jgi:hypothetical protein
MVVRSWFVRLSLVAALVASTAVCGGWKWELVVH